MPEHTLIEAEPGPDAAPDRWTSNILRTPLLVKLVVLDGLINILSFVGLQLVPADQIANLTLLSLFGVLVLNAAFVAWALGPLKDLEETARRVTRGEFTARARMGPLADRNLARIAAALNRLLDHVEAERARVRSLASQVVAAGDVERAHIARELHDGAAQSLSALQMLITATLKHDMPPEARERLGLMFDVTSEVLQEVRSLSHGMHPRVLDELGLAAALEGMVKRAAVGTDTKVVLDIDLPARLPDPVGSVLYRVTQEALHNALKHARAGTVTVRARIVSGYAEIRVTDDGRGFDPQANAGGGMGLFVMEERVGLLDGELELVTSPGHGVRVSARIPLERA